MLIPAWYFSCCMYDNLLNYALSESLGLPNCHRSEQNMEIGNGIRNYVLKNKSQESGFKSENNLHPMVETVYKVEKSVQEKSADRWSLWTQAGARKTGRARGLELQMPQERGARHPERQLSRVWSLFPLTLGRQPVQRRFCHELSVCWDI